MSENKLFDPAIQESFDGPLSKAFRDEIQNIRAEYGCSYAELAKRAGISPAFFNNLANYRIMSGKKECGIRTIHIKRLVNGVRSFYNQKESYLAVSEIDSIEKNNNNRIEKVIPLSIMDAKAGLALKFNIPVDCIDITVRG